MSWDDLNEDHYNWPDVAEVAEYRRDVRAMMNQIITELPMDSDMNWESPWWPILMGIEHENIHLETSSANFRQMPLDKITPTKYWPVCELDPTPPINSVLPVAATRVDMNKTKENAKVYGWDNEFGTKSFEVEAFKASKYLVSNAEFLEFIEAGGYSTQKWWTEEGWTWTSYEQEGGLSGIPRDHPRWWVRPDGTGANACACDGGWKLRTLQSEVPLPMSWPVNVNQLEAKAFCNWRSEMTGKATRLPSEPEWYAMRALGGAGFADKDQTDWAAGEAPGNIDLEHYASECPVDQFAWGDSGFYDVIGNVWQWTESPIDALPGYEEHPLYDVVEVGY